MTKRVETCFTAYWDRTTDESVEDVYNRLISSSNVECKIGHIRVHQSHLRNCLIAANHMNDQWLICSVEDLEDILEAEGLVLL